MEGEETASGLCANLTVDSTRLKAGILPEETINAFE
jgi:hypothetical protein